MAASCGSPNQERSLDGIDTISETVIEGTVTAGDRPAAGAYVRLLDDTGEFTAEVVTASNGRFRFFARPGTWRVRVLMPGATGETTVTAARGGVTDASISLS